MLEERGSNIVYEGEPYFVKFELFLNDSRWLGAKIQMPSTKGGRSKIVLKLLQNGDLFSIESPNLIRAMQLPTCSMHRLAVTAIDPRPL